LRNHRTPGAPSFSVGTEDAERHVTVTGDIRFNNRETDKTIDLVVGPE